MHKVSRLPKIFIILGAILLTTFSLIACDNKNVNTYTLPDVTVGDTFEITVPTRGSGQYEWNYNINSNSGLEFVAREYIPASDDPDWCGGGNSIYTFKAVKTGSYTIKFICQIIGKYEPPIETNIYKITCIEPV